MLIIYALNEYCQTWKLKINISKTKIIRFTQKRSPNFNYEFWINGEKVELVEKYVYLGTTISFNGKFKGAMDKQITQANRALFAIKSKKDQYNLPTDIMLDLFDTMILPILLYGSEVRGFENVERIEVFFRKVLKYNTHGYLILRIIIILPSLFCLLLCTLCSLQNCSASSAEQSEHF